MTNGQQESTLLESIRSRRGGTAVKWSLFLFLVIVTYAAFCFGLVLTIARIDGEFVGEVCSSCGDRTILSLGVPAYREEHYSVPAAFLGTECLPTVLSYLGILGTLPIVQAFLNRSNINCPESECIPQSAGMVDTFASDCQVPIPGYFRRYFHASIS